MTRAQEVSERDFQGLVVTFAQFQGWATFHDFDSRRSTPGFPDLVLCRPPELVFAELKTERGTITKAQQEWLDELAASGVETHVWRPSDWTDVEARLRRPKPVPA